MSKLLKNRLTWALFLGFWGIFFILVLLKLAPAQVDQNAQPKQSVVQPATSLQTNTASNHSASQLVKVTRVVDGDTVEIEGGEKVRYIGVDTPETVDPRKEVGCFGKEASDKNKQLVEGKEVRIEKDVSETDKYGRLLRYIYVGDIFINDFLVREGYAHVSTYPPDVKYQDQFLQAEKEAREAKKGLWGSICSNSSSPIPTSSSSNQSPPAGEAGTPSGNCLIKGNISSSGEKIYHLMGQQYYEKTKINESLGERWFCSEQEAVSAGWRKSKV